MVVALKIRHFTGSKKVFTAETDGLAAILRGMAIDQARLRIKTIAPAAFVDQSTGTPAATLVSLPLPAAFFNASVAGGESAAGMLSALSAINIAHDTLGVGLNLALASLGMLPLANVASASGDEYANGTIVFNVLPSPGDTVTLNGHVITFEAQTLGEDGATLTLPPGQVGIADTIAATVQALVTYVDTTPAVGVTAFSELAGTELVVSAPVAGTAGNAIALASSNNAQSLSGATLTGGATDGTISSTIPPMPKAGVTAAGNASVEYNTARAALVIVKSNHQKILHAFFRACTALGEPLPPSAVAGAYAPDFTLYPVEAPITGRTGLKALALTDATAFYLAAANNVATIAATWNAILADVAAATRPLSVIAA